MKKNLVSVLILAFTIVNLVLNAVIIFSVMPAAQKTNKMITQICSILDLELDASWGAGEIPFDDITTYSCAEDMTINLKKGADGKEHIAKIKVTISMNSKHEDYGKYGDLTEKEQLIKREINEAVSSFTYEEALQDMSAVEDEALKRVQTLYGSDFIIGVSFGERVLQ